MGGTAAREGSTIPPMGCPGALVLVLALAAAASPAPAPAADGSEPAVVREATREVLSGGGRQEILDLKEEEPPPEEAPADRPRRDSSRHRMPDPSTYRPVDHEPLLLVLRALLWTILAIVAVLSAVALLRSRRAPRAAIPAAPAAAAAPAPVAPAPPPPLAAADGLAGEGRFEEAVHALLLLALADVRSARARPFPQNATSREIAAEPGVPAGPAADLDALVRSAEPVLFGGRPADRGLFDGCRARCVSLHAALARGGS